MIFVLVLFTVVIFQGGVRHLDVVDSALVSTMPAVRLKQPAAKSPIDGEASQVVQVIQEQINAQPKLDQGKMVGKEELEQSTTPNFKLKDAEQVNLQMSGEPTQVDTGERSKTKINDPGNFLVYTLNQTDGLFNKPSEKSNHEKIDELAHKPTKHLKNDFRGTSTYPTTVNIDAKETGSHHGSVDLLNKIDETKNEEDLEEIGLVKESVGDDLHRTDDKAVVRLGVQGDTGEVVEMVEEFDTGKEEMIEEMETANNESKLAEGMERSDVRLVQLGGGASLAEEAASKQASRREPLTRIDAKPQIKRKPLKGFLNTATKPTGVPNEVGEAEKDVDGVLATSTIVTIEAEEESESFTEKVPNLFTLKLDSKKKANDVLDLLQNNLNKEEPDVASKFEAENSVATTLPNRRLPESYPGALSSCSFFYTLL